MYELTNPPSYVLNSTEKEVTYQVTETHQKVSG